MKSYPTPSTYKKGSEGVLFFDYTATSKTRVIRDASKSAGEKKQDIIKRFGPAYKELLKEQT